MDQKRKGRITELMVYAKLLKYGEVSIPYGDNCRYDCILDINNKMLKIQIKTAHKITNTKFSIPFCNSRMSAHGVVKKYYTKEQVDFIATIWKDQLLLIPITGENKTQMCISEVYPQNGIKSTVNLIQYFLPEVQLKQYITN